jgi:hypothetical protein
MQRASEEDKSAAFAAAVLRSSERKLPSGPMILKQCFSMHQIIRKQLKIIQAQGCNRSRDKGFGWLAWGTLQRVDRERQLTCLSSL